MKRWQLKLFTRQIIRVEPIYRRVDAQNLQFDPLIPMA